MGCPEAERTRQFRLSEFIMSETKALSKDGNPRAISVRIESRTRAQVTGQRNHDLRLGRQPAYVDPDRKHLNEVIIEPMLAKDLLQVCTERRDNRATKPKRAMKRNAAVATCGIITFGVEAQVAFGALELSVQSQAISAIVHAIAEQLKTTVSGLVIHRDETAVHAHFQLPAINLEGHPLTQANSRSDISRLQDLAADVIRRFEPSIERGNKRRDRLNAGATLAEVRHRQVRELHWDLPLELERERGRVAKQEARIAELEAKAELTAAEVKRLQIYAKRLRDSQARLEAIEGEARKRAEAVMAAEKQRILAEARDAAEEIKANAHKQADAVMEGVRLVIEDKVYVGPRGNWQRKTVLEPDAVARFLSIAGVLKPFYHRFMEMLAKVQQRLEQLRTLVQDLEGLREEMNHEQRQKLEEAKSMLDDPAPF